jgi:acid phosphatase family membrane protein YuiD
VTWREFICQRPWLIAFLAGSLVQIMKFAADFLRHRRPNFRVLVATGGMPSSHSAGVCALTTSVGLLEGFSSALFSVALYFSLIVMYDATGLRRSAGMQATLLNRIVDEHFAHQRKAGETRLIELLGHTPLEVVAGAALGILFALAWYTKAV